MHANRENNKKRPAVHLHASPILVVVVALGILSAIFVPNFATAYNLKNFCLQVCDLLIISLGVTYTVLNGGMDFSSTSVLALSSVVGSYIMALSPIAGTWYSIVVAILAMLVIGAVVGAINGVAVTRLKMPSFIATLSTQLLFSGMAIYFTSIVTDKASIMGMPSAFFRIGGEKAFFLPILICAVVYAFTQWLLTRTVFGRHVLLVGANQQSCFISGINVKRIVFLLFLCSGIYSGAASVILTARNQAGISSLGDKMYIDVMASIIIGGTSVFGGAGGAKNTLYGTLFVVLLSNVMNLLGMDWYVIGLVKGVIIILAALIDVLSKNQQGFAALRSKMKKTGSGRKEGRASVSE